MMDDSRYSRWLRRVDWYLREYCDSCVRDLRAYDYAAAWRIGTLPYEAAREAMRAEGWA